MRISKNKFVSVTYDLNVGQDDERELMERATEEHPLQFIFDTGTMLPAFEENIKDLEKGSKFQFSLTPENAYGEYIEEHVVELPKNIFEVNGKFDDEGIKEGVTLPMMNSNGERMNGSVLEVKDDVVVMDFNHPLAGETLHFSGEVIDVHDPTEEEIAAMNQMMGGGCGCGCDECGDDHDCEGGCGDQDCGCNH
ncbi:MAG: FKBP-type peptidyl-prolyl cis-trans isomerase [Tannerella sp.]|jgi:FKBP-type peptidyl-prolyl cis-trans isomerase SlyD|nr:FKBP-type peptidyl-prolyl cis-trans isomerase [Tannerella sp.]